MTFFSNAISCRMLHFTQKQFSLQSAIILTFILSIVASTEYERLNMYDVHVDKLILFPLHFTNMNEKVVIVANAIGGGYMGKAGAIRLGVSLGLRSFVDAETIEDMRVAGLLVYDPRKKERKNVLRISPFCIICTIYLEWKIRSY